MSLGRRKVGLEDQKAWVFNKMVEAYESRPPYPEDLIDAVARYASRKGSILDIGAGLGHLALPLAARGFSVTALEPATLMLQRLKEKARALELPLDAVLGQAERLPFDTGSIPLVIISDALHFLDVEQSAHETARVLADDGALVLITSEFSDTPFMREITRLMQSAAPRRPREIAPALTQLLKVSGIRRPVTLQLSDETPLPMEQLEGILKSISFIGPAMNPERYQRFRRDILEIKHARVWARRFTVYAGFRKHPAAFEP